MVQDNRGHAPPWWPTGNALWAACPLLPVVPLPPSVTLPGSGHQAFADCTGALVAGSLVDFSVLHGHFLQ